MLCQDCEVDLDFSQAKNMKDAEVTEMYRKAVERELPLLMANGLVAENKHDGTRVLVDRARGEVTIVNRHEVIYTIRLPEIVKAVEHVRGDFTLDGEATYINSKTNREEFTGSERRCSTHFPDFMLREEFPITLQAFDLLQWNGRILTDKPYWQRKEELLELCTQVDESIRFVTPHKNLPSAWKEVIEQDREGLILKKVESPYVHERSYSWLKLKNWRFQTCKVVGYTKGKNARNPFFGSLVLSKDERYRGCVGSGFDEWELRKVKDILFEGQVVDPAVPFDRVGEPYQPVNTDLDVLVKFYEITDSGVMRHPVFITTQ